MTGESGLRVIEREPRGESIVDTLNETMAEAERGDISSIAIALVYTDGTTGTAWSAIPSQSLLLGAVARLQWSLAQQLEEG